MARYTVNAYNTATASENKIHDDGVARSLGFGGGLVPGVDVYAYLCHPPADRWGERWLAGGTMQARFQSPVYDGDQVVVESTGEGDGEGELMALRIVDSNGTVCAEGSASLDETTEPPDTKDFPTAPLRDRADRPPASEEAFASFEDGVLGSLELGFHAANAHEYLDDIRERLPLFRTGGVAHPAWLVRQANFVLSANVKLGPWIHVSSDSTHYDAVRDGERVSIRAKVAGVYERKHHKLVDLDVLAVVVPDDRPCILIRHTAIYEPRQVSQSGSG